MEDLLRLLLTNAAAAGLLAVLAFAVSRTVRRPALAHGLWLLALVKLVTPPLVPLPLLPTWPGLPGLAATAAPTVVRMETAAAAPVASRVLPELPLSTIPSDHPMTTARLPGVEPPPGPQRLPFAALVRPLVGMALASGALVVILLGAFRFVCFRRLLAHAEPASDAIRARAAALAGAIGLRRVPPVRVVAASIPPMLWPALAGPVLLLPRELLRELLPGERDTLLAHELAHVRRRDHWVRLLELLATALFWWYPVTWWTRSALRRAEERCCDEWVLRVLPDSAQAYANGLLKSLTFVSSGASPVPALASGVSPLSELETRLKEILMSRPAPRLAAPLRVALLVAAGLSLAAFPTHARNDEPVVAARPADAAKPAAPAPAKAQAHAVTPATAATPTAAPRVAAPATPAQTAEAPPTAAIARRSAARADAERALEVEQRAFEQKRLALQQQELELQRQEIELRARAEQDEARACAEKMRAEGKASEAESCERRGELVGKRMVLEQHRLEIQAQRLALDAKQQSEELAWSKELERSREGRDAQEMAMKLLAEDRSRSGAEMTKRQRALEAEAEALAQRARVLETEKRVQTLGAASEEFARALAAQIDASRSALKDNPDARPDIEREIQRLEAALAALKAARP